MKKVLYLLLFIPALLCGQVQTIPTVTGSNSGDGEIKAIVAAAQANDDGLQVEVDTKQFANYTNINVETGTTYTFVIADDDEYTTFTNGSAVTVTIPANAAVAFPIGATIDCEQEGAGTVTFQTEDGVVTLEAFGSDTVSAGQGAVFTLIKKDTNVWRLIGTL